MFGLAQSPFILLFLLIFMLSAVASTELSYEALHLFLFLIIFWEGFLFNFLSMEQHTESSIIKELRRYFQNGYNYRIDNAFIFGYDWESDFFCTNREGWAFEFEVKISRADFKADLKKKKHEIFIKGTYQKQTTFDRENKKWNTAETEKKFIPNRFYYVVPEGMITKEEVPEYAGLIYINSCANIIKRAPFIHRRKLEVRHKLCDKFYNRWIDERRRNNLLAYDHKQLIDKVEKFNEKYPDDQIFIF